MEARRPGRKKPSDEVQGASPSSSLILRVWTMKIRHVITASVVASALTGATVALNSSAALAAPIDHCKPRSACICGWEIVDGKQQYVCRVIKQPR
jgi:hypothetical protein